jgi:inosine-uridine nucleoside N-ribohydrolase
MRSLGQSLLGYMIYNFRNQRTSLVSVRAMSISMSSKPKPRRVIVDTDVGFDDLVAIQSIETDIDLVTTTCGMSESHAGARAIRRLCPNATKVVASDPVRDRPQHHSWIPDFRQRFGAFVELHGQASTQTDHADDSICATEATLQLLSQSDDESVDIIALGPLTNIANLLILDEALVRSKINKLWLLGGNHPERGHEMIKNGGTEFNFGQDPIAAAKVLESPSLSGKIWVVPGSETHYNQVPSSYVDSILSVVKDRDDLLSRTIRADPHYAVFFDPIAVFVYHNPTAATFAAKKVHVCSSTGILSHGDDESTEHHMASEIEFERYKEWLTSRIYRQGR